MKPTTGVLAFCLCFTLLGTRTYPVFAKAPATAKIVFASNFEGKSDIHLMNPDGSQLVNITNHRSHDTSPVWSPTGEQILFVSDREQPRFHCDLYLMDADGRNLRRVFPMPAYRCAPTWSPDGKQIAYHIQEPRGTFIYIGTIDGKNEEAVTRGRYPVWSPNGMEIAFVGRAEWRQQLHILNLRTRKQKVLFPPPKIRESKIRSAPTWSPAGDKLAFSWKHKVPLEAFPDSDTIYIINRNGTGLKQIVHKAEVRAEAPVWSPRGNELLYQQFDDVRPQKKRNKQLFKITVNGGEPEQLTHTRWNKTGDWFDPIVLSVQLETFLITTTWGRVKIQN